MKITIVFAVIITIGFITIVSWNITRLEKKIKESKLSQRDMDFINRKEITREDILGAYRRPPPFPLSHLSPKKKKVDKINQID